jgi:hypothetical protein
MKLQRSVCLMLSIMLLVCVPGCRKELRKAVYIQYDQVNNFRNYAFQAPFPVESQESSRVVSGVRAGTDDNRGVVGLWMTFLICSVGNSGPDAEAFTYDVSKFYVVVEGKRYYAATLQPYTFMYQSDEFGQTWFGTPMETPTILKQLRYDTELGDTPHTFAAHQETFPLFRFAIYVNRPPPQIPDKTRLQLRYDSSHPHFLDTRNQDPIFISGNYSPGNGTTYATRNDLLGTCRPKIQHLEPAKP